MAHFPSLACLLLFLPLLAQGASGLALRQAQPAQESTGRIDQVSLQKSIKDGGQRGHNDTNNLALDRPTQQDAYHIGKSGSHLPKALQAVLDAIDVMQTQYFDIFTGTWPSAIDWTAAVCGT